MLADRVLGRYLYRFHRSVQLHHMPGGILLRRFCKQSRMPGRNLWKHDRTYHQFVYRSVRGRLLRKLDSADRIHMQRSLCMRPLLSGWFHILNPDRLLRRNLSGFDRRGFAGGLLQLRR